MDIGIITKDELHFGYDKQIFKKLETSKEPKLQELFKIYNKRINNFYLVDFGKGQINTKPKFRGVDPLVYYKGNYQALSKIDEDFNRHFNSVKEWCKKGYGINYYDFNDDL